MVRLIAGILFLLPPFLVVPRPPPAILNDPRRAQHTRSTGRRRRTRPARRRVPPRVQAIFLFVLWNRATPINRGTLASL